MGHVSARERTLNPRTEISFPPGARLSSLTIPVTETADSLVTDLMASMGSCGVTPPFAETWTYPVPSLTTAKTRPPMALLEATHPLTSTASPAFEPKTCLTRTRFG